MEVENFKFLCVKFKTFQEVCKIYYKFSFDECQILPFQNSALKYYAFMFVVKI